MGRLYPRFLFSNPQNTKSKGPFVVHCLYPRAIFGIEYSVREEEGTLTITPLDFFESCSEDEAESLHIDLKEWLFTQIKNRSIKI